MGNTWKIHKFVPNGLFLDKNRPNIRKREKFNSKIPIMYLHGEIFKIKAWKNRLNFSQKTSNFIHKFNPRIRKCRRLTTRKLRGLTNYIWGPNEYLCVRNMCNFGQFIPIFYPKIKLRGP